MSFELPGWLIALASGLTGLLVGIGAVAALVRRGHLARAPTSSGSAAVARRGPALVEAGDPDAELAPGSVSGLVARSLREPLMRLKRTPGAPTELVEELERLAWQCRMLASVPRPMKARPASPIELLERASEAVPTLNLGKVCASWTLRCRQPVYVDAERTGAAFRELLAAAADAVGDGGRIGIRILPGGDQRYPVCVEVEIGRPGAEPDPLPVRVARHLLESQGARLEVDGERTRIFLRSLPAEGAAQAPSNT